MQIWDTADFECYSSIRQTYYKIAGCAIFVYDITNKESFIVIIVIIKILLVGG